MNRPVLGRTIAESIPDHSPIPRPPRGAPNVVVIVLDDLGFGQLGCFGSDIDTPNLDALASGGLRYNRFHVTAMCSPTRAALLTGRNHHAVGMGFLPDVPIGFPGYNGRIPPSAATLPRTLRDNGYSTFAVGKWHLAPRWELSASGPFDRWPLGLGFERYYGFLGGDTNQYAPELVRDNGFVDPPAGPADGYHLTEDLADQAIRMVRDQQHATPGKPFFLYLATGAVHAPHQVPAEWSDRYRGRFDDGWDAWRDRLFDRQRAAGIVPGGTTLPPRPPWVREFASCSESERRLYARMMEVFAGFLSHTDHQIGRVVDHLAAIGELDNTLLFVLSDNGTSAEGGPTGSLNEHRFTHDRVDDLDDTIARMDELGTTRAYNHYPWGWAWAGNTPLRLWKRYTWLGGVRTPLIVHWPRGITDAGAIRDQFCHVTDLVPTVLDAVGISAPAVVDGVAQQPLAGASLRESFTDADAPDARATQYFELLGSRAIYHDGWKATTDHVGRQLSVEQELLEGSLDFATDRWSLFDLRDDFAEAHDVAAEHPDLVRELEARWWTEAGRNQVLPLDDTFTGRATALEPAPWGVHARVRYRPGGGPIAEDTMPPLGAGFRLRAHLDVDAAGRGAGSAAPGAGSPESGAGAAAAVPGATPGAAGAPAGVLAALGDWNNGFALYLLRGRPVFAMSLFGAPVRVEGTEPLAPGGHTVGVEYTRRPGGGAGGTIVLAVDGTAAGSASVAVDLPFRWQVAGAGLRIGHDVGLPVCDDYEPPFPCTAVLHEVVVESTLLVPPDPEAVVRTAITHE